MTQGSRLSGGQGRLGRSITLVLITALGLMVMPAARATLPAPPAPCPKSFDAAPVESLIEKVKEAGEHPDARWGAGCASEALSRRSEEVIPHLVALMETHQTEVELLALGAVCGPGHSGATAIPYIEVRLRTGGRSFAYFAYNTLVCIGKGARIAIPLLMEKSQGVGLTFTYESDLAIETLGRLFQYDPDRILTHLVRLLDQPEYTRAAARALAQIGEPARSAQGALRRSLLRAVDSKQDEAAVVIISALARLGSPRPTVAILIPLLDRPAEADAAARALEAFGRNAKPALSALLNRLNVPDTPWSERADEVRALIASGVQSPVVLKAVLDELTPGKNWLGDYTSAVALAKIESFPPELAPALVAAIERRDADDMVRHELQVALAHTGTSLVPVERAKLPPHDASDRLADGLWALTVQSEAIAPDDVVKQLRVDLNDYQQDGNSISHGWRRKPIPSPQRAAAALIDSIQLNGIHSFSGLPGTQQLDIYLDEGYCVSVDDMRARIAPEPAIPDPSVIIVSAYNGSSDSGTLRIGGDHSADKSKARSSLISLGPRCHSHIKIEKTFDSEYWSYVCPLAYDRELTANLLIPAVQKQLGPQFGRFDFDTPEISDYDWNVNLTYREILTDPARADWQAFRLSILVDRCSHSVSNITKYIP